MQEWRGHCLFLNNLLDLREVQADKARWIVDCVDLLIFNPAADRSFHYTELLDSILHGDITDNRHWFLFVCCQELSPLRIAFLHSFSSYLFIRTNPTPCFAHSDARSLRSLWMRRCRRVARHTAYLARTQKIQR